MKRLSIALALVTLLPYTLGGQTPGAPVETLYADAKAKEKAVRTALTDPSATLSTLKAVRTVVADYEALVRRYPASAYSDDALWFAGWLALDAHERFSDEHERAAAVRLWRALAAQYPASKLAKQVPQQLAKVKTAPIASAPASAPVMPASSDPLTTRPTPEPTPPVATQLKPDPISESESTRSRPDPASPSVATRLQPDSTSRAAANTPEVRPNPDPTSVSGATSGPAAAPSPSRTGLATLKGIRRTVLADTVRVTIELDREIAFRDERLEGPARVFVDLPSTRASAEFIDRTIRFDSDADLVRQIRIGRHANNLTRIVLDVTGISTYSVYALYSPYRIVIECVRGRPNPPPVARAVAPRSPLLLASRTVSPLFKSLPAPPVGIAPPDPEPVPPLVSRATTPDLTTAAAAPGNAPRQPLASAATPPAAGASTTNPALAPPKKNVGGGFSIARQLGLGVSRIVIDPGHGGHDPGATGTGVTEAALVLDVALRLEKLLATVPGVEVILTRRGDEFVTLQERTAIANREGADLFLSIHANASSNLRVQGVETYFLNFATTSTAAAVAARENASSGQPMAALPDFVKAIALHNKLDESRDLATLVQRALVERLVGANRSLRDLGVKQAPFVVLIGASMPSVLTEISFLSNAEEVKLLRGNTYRQHIAEALFNAIRKYQDSLKTEVKATQ